MDGPPPHRRVVEPARSFDLVADAYDRARPSYPDAAVEWLAGSSPRRVLELGAGTGKLTEQLLALGHTVVATDHSETMLRRLGARAPRAQPVAASAEAVPMRARSFDTVVCAQAFHWFDVQAALRESERVLVNGGTLALVWNQRDDRIPWVRRLGGLLGASPGYEAVVPALETSPLFGWVERTTFRFWQPLTADSLRELVISRSNIAVLPPLERERVLRKVDALYDEYGRGADGMLLPYVTHTFRATVTTRAELVPPASPARPAAPAPFHHPTEPDDPDDLDTDSLLIDFR